MSDLNRAVVRRLLGLFFAFTVTNVNHNVAQWILLSEFYVVVGILPITYKLLKRRKIMKERFKSLGRKIIAFSCTPVFSCICMFGLFVCSIAIGGC